jgi:hypothetical protein
VRRAAWLFASVVTAGGLQACGLFFSFDDYDVFGPSLVDASVDPLDVSVDAESDVATDAMTDAACSPSPVPQVISDGAVCELAGERNAVVGCPGANACNGCVDSECCYPLDAAAPPTCPSGKCEGIPWPCDGVDSCNGGQCCIFFLPEVDSPVCPRPEKSLPSTRCRQAGCFGHDGGEGDFQVCRNSSECAPPSKCIPVTVRVVKSTRVVGICLP